MDIMLCSNLSHINRMPELRLRSHDLNRFDLALSTSTILWQSNLERSGDRRTQEH